MGLFSIQNTPTSGLAANIRNILTSFHSPVIAAEVYSIALLLLKWAIPKSILSSGNPEKLLKPAMLHSLKH